MHAVAVRVNDEVTRDLSWRPEDGDRLESVPIESDEGRAILRHSTAHVLAQAVQDLFPEAKLGIGPPIVNGFYYDFDVEPPVHPRGRRAHREAHAQILKRGQRFSRRVVTDDEARTELADEPYKLELISLKGGGDVSDEEAVEAGGPELTIYDNIRVKGDDRDVWSDLCRGPHVPDTRHIPALQADAHRRPPTGAATRRTRSCSASTAPPGSPRKRSTRTCTMLEEAEKRDHRRLGTELDLFSLPDRDRRRASPSGTPRAAIVRRVMEEYARRRHEQAGYYVRHHAAPVQGAAVPDRRPPAVVRRRHVPAHGDGGRRRTTRSR